jgi:hypothetical protein
MLESLYAEVLEKFMQPIPAQEWSDPGSHVDSPCCRDIIGTALVGRRI